MSDLKKVTGSECLDYINKDVGIASHNNFIIGHDQIMSYVNSIRSIIYGRMDNKTLNMDGFAYHTSVIKWHNDKTKRVVGLVTDKSEDGGLRVAILGNNLTMVNRDNRSGGELVGGCKWCHVAAVLQGQQTYQAESLPPFDYKPVKEVQQFPAYRDGTKLPNSYCINGNSTGANVSYEDAVNLEPVFDYYLQTQVFGSNIWYQGAVNPNAAMTITTNKNNTVVAGEIYQLQGEQYFPAFMCDNPLQILSGNLYSFLTNMSMKVAPILSKDIEAGTDFNDLVYMFAATPVRNSNWCTYPFNLILTRNENDALNYINNGVLPSDAWLYPLDWESIPGYQEPDDDDTPGTDDNTPDDDIRDVTPNPPITPAFTPQQLSNNNYYWITAPQLEDFLNWYWNDIGDISDIDDLLAKIEGLYNNLSQAILNIRFMPVEYDWICELPEGVSVPVGNIKIAQIEKAGNVDMLSKQGKPKVRDIGHITIPNKYNSFVDLSPYSQLSLYLPFHGFLDIDMNIFSGHSIYVKAIYDFMSGTIQYLLYYDNEFLVNSIMCKIAIDIPISLQTKNDRDSAVFSNVSNVVGGLMGAGLSLGTGNPMGLLVGASAFNSGVASAPLNVKGNIGEQGALYAPPQCAIILRRPTISKPTQDIWQSKVGQICGKSYTLGNLSGYTTVYNPQITFNGNKNADGVVMKPLQSEIEEIYQALEKGVIL